MIVELTDCCIALSSRCASTSIVAGLLRHLGIEFERTDIESLFTNYANALRTVDTPIEDLPFIGVLRSPHERLISYWRSNENIEWGVFCRLVYSDKINPIESLVSLLKVNSRTPDYCLWVDTLESDWSQLCIKMNWQHRGLLPKFKRTNKIDNPYPTVKESHLDMIEDKFRDDYELMDRYRGRRNGLYR